MGVCYKLILLDEFNWNYVNTDRDQRLQEFQQEYKDAGAYCCELEHAWYGGALFDVDKCGPYNPKYREVIRKFSDSAYFIDDLNSTLIRNIDEIS